MREEECELREWLSGLGFDLEEEPGLDSPTEEVFESQALLIILAELVQEQVQETYSLGQGVSVPTEYSEPTVSMVQQQVQGMVAVWW